MDSPYCSHLIHNTSVLHHPLGTNQAQVHLFHERPDRTVRDHFGRDAGLSEDASVISPKKQWFTITNIRIKYRQYSVRAEGRL